MRKATILLVLLFASVSGAQERRTWEFGSDPYEPYRNAVERMKTSGRPLVTFFDCEPVGLTGCDVVKCPPLAPWTSGDIVLSWLDANGKHVGEKLPIKSNPNDEIRTALFRRGLLRLVQPAYSVLAPVFGGPTCKT